MNTVQHTYTPPRSIALVLSGLVFAIYQVFWRPTFLTDHAKAAFRAPDAAPVPLLIALGLSFILGYGLTLLGWLILRTKGQIWATFKPTLGRILGAFCLAMVTPLAVMSYLPWIFGGLIPFVFTEAPLLASGVTLLATALAYPFSAMIVRHTYDRRLLRFGLFCLVFWTGYAGHLLYSGEVVFRL